MYPYFYHKTHDRKLHEIAFSIGKLWSSGQLSWYPSWQMALTGEEAGRTRGANDESLVGSELELYGVYRINGV